MQGCEIGKDLRRGEGAPWAVRHLGCLLAAHAEQKPCLLEGLADGGEREGTYLVRARALQPLHEMRLVVRVERPRDRHAPVHRIDPPAGKDELPGHELVALVALAE